MESAYISYLPHLNACLNATSAVLLLSGYSFIRARNVAAHRACQVAALVVSLLFLTSYLIYHYNHGSTRFQGTGIVLSLIHISEPTRLLSISYAVFCLKKK